jgi:hypothetical protein
MLLALTIALTITFLLAWLAERSHRKYYQVRANAFDRLSVKLKQRLRAEIDIRHKTKSEKPDV